MELSGDEWHEIFDFLNLIMYPHDKDFMKDMSKYIDFSDNEQLGKETQGMIGLGQCFYEDGIKEGMEQGIQQGMIMLIQAFNELGIPRDTALMKVMSKYSLSKEDAENYFNEFWKE